MEDEYARMDEVLDLSHILLFLPEKTVGKDTAAIYQRALEIRTRIQNGEDFEVVGKELMQQDPKHIGYEHVRGFYPMRTVKAFEDAVYSMPEGTLSMPVRTKLGFHIIKLHHRIPNPGRVQVTHILLPFATDSVKQDEIAIKNKADSIYHQLQSGADFGALAEKFSADKATAAKKGVLPVFGIGEMVQDFEKEAFALQKEGEISQPFKTQFGYHVIRRNALPKAVPFEKVKDAIKNQLAAKFMQSYVESLQKSDIVNNITVPAEEAAPAEFFEHPKDPRLQEFLSKIL